MVAEDYQVGLYVSQPWGNSPPAVTELLSSRQELTVSDITELFDNLSVQQLSLAAHSLDPNGAPQALAESIARSMVLTDLSFEGVTSSADFDVVAVCASALVENLSVQRLNLAGCGLTWERLIHLGEQVVPWNRTVVDWNVADNPQLGDEGVIGFITALVSATSSVQRLCLRNTGLRDVKKAAALLEELTCLYQVDLSGNPGAALPAKEAANLQGALLKNFQLLHPTSKYRENAVFPEEDPQIRTDDTAHNRDRDTEPTPLLSSTSQRQRTPSFRRQRGESRVGFNKAAEPADTLLNTFPNRQRSSSFRRPATPPVTMSAESSKKPDEPETAESVAANRLRAAYVRRQRGDSRVVVHPKTAEPERAPAVETASPVRQRAPSFTRGTAPTDVKTAKDNSSANASRHLTVPSERPSPALIPMVVVDSADAPHDPATQKEIVERPVASSTERSQPPPSAANTPQASVPPLNQPPPAPPRGRSPSIVRPNVSSPARTAAPSSARASSVPAQRDILDGVDEWRKIQQHYNQFIRAGSPSSKSSTPRSRTPQKPKYCLGKRLEDRPTPSAAFKPGLTRCRERMPTPFEVRTLAPWNQPNALSSVGDVVKVELPERTAVTQEPIVVTFVDGGRLTWVEDDPRDLGYYARKVQSGQIKPTCPLLRSNTPRDMRFGIDPTSGAYVNRYAQAPPPGAYTVPSEWERQSRKLREQSRSTTGTGRPLFGSSGAPRPSFVKLAKDLDNPGPGEYEIP